MNILILDSELPKSDMYGLNPPMLEVFWMHINFYPIEVL